MATAVPSAPAHPLQNMKATCERRDLNPYAERHQILSLACLPFHHSRNPSATRIVAEQRLFVKALRHFQALTLDEPRRFRTFDPQIKSLLLCQLS